MSRRTLQVERAISECKGVLRHAWYDNPGSGHKSEFGTVIANKCERCDSERVMVVSRSGQVISKWRYIYPDKALYKSVSAASMDDWRAQYIAEIMRQRRNRRAS